MIQLSALSKSFGDRVLLDSVTWQIDDRERVGLSGPNGAGKTTLLKMLAGLEEPDGGTIVKPSGLTIGYLPQDGLELQRADAARGSGPRVQAAARHARRDRGARGAARRGRRAQAEHEAMLTRYASCRTSSAAATATPSICKVTTVLRGLGFAEDDMEKATEAFSGGWQMRIALAKLLLGRPGLLLLDEPTNHLDLDARNWLEEYLLDYPHAVILVSHDRYFLDAVVTRITEIGLRTLTDYHGNYTAFESERDARLERLRQTKRDQDEEIARMQARSSTASAIRRRRRRRSRAGSRCSTRSCRSRSRRSAGACTSTFPACAKSGRMVLELKHVAQGVRRPRDLRRPRSCTSSAATASRSSARTAPASPR